MQDRETITGTEAGSSRKTTDRHNPEPLALGPAQAARALGISRGQLYLLLAAGKIPSFKLGRRRLIRRCDILNLMERALEDTAQQRLHGESFTRGGAQ